MRSKIGLRMGQGLSKAICVASLATAAIFHSVHAADRYPYELQITPPPGWTYWFLAVESPQDASEIFSKPGAPETQAWINEHRPIKIKAGTRVLMLGGDTDPGKPGMAEVQAIDDQRMRGFIDLRALELTPEGKILKQKHDKLAAQRRSASRAKRDEALRAEAEIRRAKQYTCSSLYSATADKRIADLTVREEQQVRACQAAGMYGQ